MTKPVVDPPVFAFRSDVSNGPNDLPGQTLPQRERDLRQAIGIGLDHLGLYHLVMFPGLGTEWSRDPALVAQLPENSKAADNWLRLRGLLQLNGFYQSNHIDQF